MCFEYVFSGLFIILHIHFVSGGDGGGSPKVLEIPFLSIDSFAVAYGFSIQSRPRKIDVREPTTLTHTDASESAQWAVQLGKEKLLATIRRLFNGVPLLPCETHCE